MTHTETTNRIAEAFAKAVYETEYHGNRWEYVSPIFQKMRIDIERVRATIAVSEMSVAFTNGFAERDRYEVSTARTMEQLLILNGLRPENEDNGNNTGND